MTHRLEKQLGPGKERTNSLQEEYMQTELDFGISCRSFMMQKRPAPLRPDP
jgi:hypothetical protein